MPRDRKQTVMIALLVLMSLQIYVVWAILLARGAFAGVFVSESHPGMPIFHLTAEFLMATVTLIGALGWWRGAPWGTSVTLLGVGMAAYATINAMGWAVVANLPLLTPMVIFLVVVAVVSWSITRRHAGGHTG